MKVLLTGAGMVAGIVLLFFGLQTFMVIFNQEEQLFMEQTISEERAFSVSEERDDLEELSIDATDGVTLHGWLRHAANDQEKQPLVIYFGGNAEEQSQAIPTFDHLSDWSVLFMNYRGYGLSEGEPGQDELYSDAKTLFDTMSERDDINEDKIVLMGRSMGTAPAVHASDVRDAKGTILISPYDSRTRLQEHRHPYLPISSFIRHPFELSDRASDIESPLLTVIGTEDRVIPPQHSETTAEQWGGRTNIVHLEGYGHNNLQQNNRFVSAIETFLEELD
ncbi:alpha/beta hydrolase [Salisediminibacterium halotolerans]|uniref:alpha/beta hydrolase n=1 Tax=Salisediminibacterium halotolerans TaxID=517425 RepID=UPI000EAD3D57|nr:alpha/beta hydrolase [Salisediminibacterium halotolerans]RLJ74414.1 hypothetical protein BCL39_1704 [Actinophytocola xinjiangensis]RPE87493.1 hypothetical protein EDD67_1227 [Salisediminibacterium halotolerans]TWG35251.1 hypothetical protein BCL52_1701 [Salisediminibacterium halotolerans]GEL06731.1 alpha/beta hydrolase [Salisediminibacterium halotolerans]